MRAEILRELSLLAIAHGDVQVAGGVEQQRGAEMRAGLESRTCLKDGACLLEFIALQAKPPDPGRALCCACWDGGAQVDPAILGKFGVHRHIQQTPLPAVEDLWHASQRCQAVGAGVQHAQTAWLLGDKQAAIGQEGHSPGELEFVCQCLYAEVLACALPGHRAFVDFEAFFERHIGFQRTVLQRVAAGEHARGD